MNKFDGVLMQDGQEYRISDLLFAKEISDKFDLQVKIVSGVFYFEIAGQSYVAPITPGQLDFLDEKGLTDKCRSIVKNIKELKNKKNSYSFQLVLEQPYIHKLHIFMIQDMLQAYKAYDDHVSISIGLLKDNIDQVNFYGDVYFPGFNAKRRKM